MTSPAREVDSAVSASRNVRVFGATSFLNDTASEMAYWVLPAFLVSLGAGPATLGFIEGIAESVASFAKLFSGYTTDRLRRRKPIVVAGYAVANAVKPILALATAWWHVLLIRFADRFSKGIRDTPRDVMLAESVDKNHLGSAFGLLQAMDSAGAVLGPLVAALLLAHYGLRAVFWAAAVPGLLCILVVTLGTRETGHFAGGIPKGPDHARSAGAPEQEASPASSLGMQLPAGFYFMLIAVTLFSLGNSSDMFLVLRAQGIGIPVRLAPALGLVFNITYTAFSWPAGKLSDRVSKHVLAASGYVVFAVVYFSLAYAPSRRSVWAMMALYGLFYALTNPVLRALVVGTVPSGKRGRALGIFYFVTSIATLLASVITGELWKHWGPKLPFSISAWLALLSAGLLLAVAPYVKREAA